MSSHRTMPDYLKPPRSSNSPTFPDLVCSCFRVSQSKPPTYRI